ncbi:MAG: hypothetical protein ACJ8E1_15430 [Xanthobacteraceae bacterium]
MSSVTAMTPLRTISVTTGSCWRRFARRRLDFSDLAILLLRLRLEKMSIFISFPEFGADAWAPGGRLSRSAERSPLPMNREADKRD